MLSASRPEVVTARGPGGGPTICRNLYRFRREPTSRLTAVNSGLGDAHFCICSPRLMCKMKFAFCPQMNPLGFWTKFSFVDASEKRFPTQRGPRGPQQPSQTQKPKTKEG